MRLTISMNTKTGAFIATQHLTVPLKPPLGANSNPNIAMDAAMCTSGNTMAILSFRIDALLRLAHCLASKRSILERMARACESFYLWA